MKPETEIFFALGLDKTGALRKIAAAVAFRYWMEMHRYGEFSNNVSALNKIVKRFRLGDWIMAVSAHYPLKHA